MTRPISTRQAAEIAGLTPDRFRSEMSRERKRGRDYRLPADQWHDHRSPLWDADAVQAWATTRRTLK